VNRYEEPSTPELDDLQQEEESESIIEVPVCVKSIGPVQVHTLPARDAISRSVTANTDVVQQLVGGNLRRNRMVVWATSDTAAGFIFIGTDKNEVESETCARLPASVDTLVEGPPIMLTMHHAMPVWIKNTGDNPIIVSFIAEDWAD
jgi:hypothetical protein